MTKQIRGAIFDIDGTLIDSNDAHAHAWVQAMKEQGYDVPFAKVRPLIGMGGDKVLPETIGIEKNSLQGQQIDSRRSEIFKERYLPYLQPFPDARELLQHMHNHGCKLAIATSAKPDEMEAMLEIIGPNVKELFEQATTSKDAAQSKPDPDVMQAALNKIKMSPDEVLMVGDTAYDIEAAAKVGVKTVALRCGGWSDKDLQGAITLYDSPADFLIHYNASPFVKGVS